LTVQDYPEKPMDHMISVPGGKIWAKVVGDAPGIPLLVLHGGPGMPSDYLESLTGLADERTVVFYDQLGCGRSDKPTAAEGFYVADRFIAELDCVRSALNLTNVHLLGQSWGGMLAALYASGPVSGVQSVVFESPVIDVDRWLADCATLKSNLPSDVIDTIDRHEALGNTSCPEYAAANLEWWRRHVCLVNPFPEDVERALAGFGVECYEAMWGPSEFTCTGNLSGVSLSSRLSAIECPTLFTCGRFDEATPETIKMFASQARGAYRVFENSSHMAHLEEREEFLECVRAFFRSVERK
jgi:proline-specific peptidase